jgi:hypothetical protein
VDGVDVAVKDYSRCSFLIRHALGRWLTRRECAAYRVASGLPGVAEFLGRAGPYRLATRWIEGRSLAELADRSVADEHFVRLESVLAGLHGRGLALGDLHYRDVLIGEHGSVHLVDLATAFCAGPRPGSLRRAVFEHLRQADLWGLFRLRRRFSSAAPAAPAEACRRAVVWHRRARRIKALWDRLRGAPRLAPADPD